MKKNSYSALGEKSVGYLSLVLFNKFQFQHNVYVPLFASEESSKMSNITLSELNIFISNFLEDGVIEKCTNLERKNGIAKAITPIGLKDMEWISQNNTLKFVISPLELFEALVILYKVHRTLRIAKLQGFLNLLKLQAEKLRTTYCYLDIKNINKLAYTLDRACLLFPKKTKCLPWAGALTLLLLKRRVKCNFLIGVQSMPFYSHAWVEVDGRVINDNPEVNKSLAPIFVMSF